MIRKTLCKYCRLIYINWKTATCIKKNSHIKKNRRINNVKLTHPYEINIAKCINIYREKCAMKIAHK